MQIERTNTILYCQNWHEIATFYRDIFAFPVTCQTDWFVEFRLIDCTYLSVTDERRASIHSVSGQGITLSWQMPNLEAVRATLLDQNVTVSPIRPKWDASVFYLHDPEGHRIELW